MSVSIINDLVSLGLSDYEAKIYIELSKHSPASASFIAKKLTLSRSTVYTAIERLITKGLVGVSYKNEVKQFIAEPPSVIEELLNQEQNNLNQKFDSLESIMTHVQALRTENTLIPKIVFFEGKESLKKIYMSMLRDAPENSTMYIIRDEFVWKDEWNFIFKKSWMERVKRWRTQKNIQTQLLINDSKEERKQKAYYDSRKFLFYRHLSEYSFVKEFAIYILGDTVSVLSMEQNNLVGIKMTNRHIAQNFEALFHGLWQEVKK